MYGFPAVAFVGGCAAGYGMFGESSPSLGALAGLFMGAALVAVMYLSAGGLNRKKTERYTPDARRAGDPVSNA